MIVAVAFFGAGILDIPHILVTGPAFEPFVSTVSPTFKSWSEAAPKIFFGAVLWLSCAVPRLRGRQEVAGKIHALTLDIGCVGLIAAIAGVLFLAPAPWLEILPAGLHRAQDLVPAALLLLALVGYLQRGRWRDDRFEYWLVFAMMVSVVGQAANLVTLDNQLGEMAGAAHLVTEASYIFVLAGLFISAFLVFKREHENSEALSETQRLLLLAQESAKLGYWQWRAADDKIVSVSAEFRRIWGISDDEVFESLESNLAYIHPDDAERAREVDRSLRISPHDFTLEYRILNRNGEMIDVFERGTVQCDAQGAAVGIVGTVQDITELKRAEEKLLESGRRLATAGKIAKLGYWHLDKDQDLFLLSDEVSDIFGLPPGQRLETLDDSFSRIHPDDREGVKNAYFEHTQAHGEAEDFTLAYRITRADGELRHIHEICAVDYDAEGRSLGYTGVLQDVTERVAIERRLAAINEGLRESEARFRSLVANVPGAFYRSRVPDGKVLFMSEGIERLTGTPKDYFEGKRIQSAWPFIFDEDVPLVEETIEKSLETREPFAVEYRIHGKDGETLWFSEYGRPIADPETGDLCWLDGLVFDVTEKKRAEQALRKSEAELHSKAEELARSNRELNDFAYVASRDLKEPLRGIYNYSNFLIEDYEDRLDEDGKAKLHTLVRLSKRMDLLIDALLTYSRVGHETENVETIELDGVLDEIRENLGSFLIDHAAVVRVFSPLPSVERDRNRVAEVFQSLITNGVKYNLSEEKVVEVGTVAGRAGGPVFYVRDNGIGIPEKHRDSVFRMFKRLHGRDEYSGGTGAGLTIVKKIVEQSGGWIELESREGEGTTFYFSLQGRKEPDEQ